MLNDFMKWAASMGLRFSMENCYVVHFGERNPGLHNYLNENRVAPVGRVKNLGVVVPETLHFTVHIECMVHRATMISSWISRTFVLSRPSPYLKLCIISLIRPHSLVCVCRFESNQ